MFFILDYAIDQRDLNSTILLSSTSIVLIPSLLNQKILRKNARGQLTVTCLQANPQEPRAMIQSNSSFFY